MSNVTIGQLDNIAAPSLSALLEAEQDGASGNITLEQLRTLLAVSMTRQTVTISAAAGGAAVLDAVTMGQLVYLLHVASDTPARLRLYATAAERNADQDRLITTDPSPGTGCLFEGTTTASLLGWNNAPIPLIQNNESPLTSAIAYTLEPQSDEAVNFTLTYMVIQA